MESEYKPLAEVTAVKYGTFDESSDDEQISDPDCFGWLAVWFACCCCTMTQKEFEETFAEEYIRHHGTLKAVLELEKAALDPAKEARDAAKEARDAAGDSHAPHQEKHMSRVEKGPRTVRDDEFGGVPSHK